MSRETDLEIALDQTLEAVRLRGLAPNEAMARFPGLRSELEPLLQLALSLKPEPAVEPTLAFRQASRQRLMTAIRARPRQRRLLGILLHPTFPRLGSLAPFPSAIAASIAAVMLLGVFSVSASAGALPGGVLYPLKLAKENVQLALASESVRELLRLTFAERRLEEALELVILDEPWRVNDAAAAYGQVVTAAGQGLGAAPAEERAARLQKVLQEHEAVLEEVLELAPSRAKPGLERALEASNQGLERARGLLARERDGGRGGEAPPRDSSIAALPPESARDEAESGRAGATLGSGDRSDARRAASPSPSAAESPSRARSGQRDPEAPPVEPTVLVETLVGQARDRGVEPRGGRDERPSSRADGEDERGAPDAGEPVRARPGAAIETTEDDGSGVSGDRLSEDGALSGESRLRELLRELRSQRGEREEAAPGQRAGPPRASPEPAQGGRRRTGR